MSGSPIITSIVLFMVNTMFGACSAQLSPTFYANSRANVSGIVRRVVEKARQNDARIGAKIIHLHFHDCFVNGCDGSLLLDDDDGNDIDSEKNEPVNGSIEGFEVIDDIKSSLENACPDIVSCSDIVALASQILVSLDGGPTWQVPLGRRDSRIANRTGIRDIPGPFLTLGEMSQKFANQGLDSTDLVALSGAHIASCFVLVHRLYNFSNTGRPDPSLDRNYLQILRQRCPEKGASNTLSEFDPTTPNHFDKNYFTNLENNRRLLQTDQELLSTPGADTIPIVKRFGKSQTDFFDAFVRSMIKTANIRPLTGSNGEIRSNCRKVN